jgi:glycosyltransferase involved in cell wall biosynthesis
VRDYWPICYWSDLIVDYGRQTLCPACSVGGMLDCLRPRAGVAWPVALPMIPYMRGNLARKARALSSADAVIAVSSVIGRDLLARCRGLSESRLHVIPNPVDLAWLAREVDSTTPPRAAPYAVYSGKLAPNKGIGKLVEAVARAGMRAPLVIVGDGPERARVEAAAAAAGLDVQLTGWLPRAEALRWVAHAAWLIFPSHGPESLSRVLLEAGALGVPVAAMDTGGTRDIVHHERTGLLSHDVEGLARDIRRLELDADLRARLGRAARAHVTETFDSTRVAPRVIDVYDSLVDLAPRGRHV